MLGGIEWRHVGSVRGNTRPAGAVVGWARLLAGASALAFVGASSAVAALALAMIPAPTPAQAHHNKPVRLCERKFSGQFFSFRNYPIETAGGRRLGRLAIAVQTPVVRHGRPGWRAMRGDGPQAP